MAKMGAGSKMKKIIFIMLLLSFGAFAQVADETAKAEPSLVDVHNMEPLQLADAIAAGTVTNFGAIRAENLIAALQQRPEIASKFDDLSLLNVLSTDPRLVDNARVFGTLDVRIKNNPSLANNNPIVKDAWFKQYGIKDEGASVKSYDGVNLQTDGLRGTTFKVKDFPGAKVLKDGTLVLGNMHFAGASSLRREIVDADGTRVLELVGGVAEVHKDEDQLVPDTNFQIRIKSESGKDGILKIDYGDEIVNYLGNFEYDNGRVRGTDEKPFLREVWNNRLNRALPSAHVIRGEILEKDTYPAAFSIVTKPFALTEVASMSVNPDGSLRHPAETVFRIRNTDSQEIYFTEARSGAGLAKDFCEFKPCIVNAAGKNGDPRYREKMGFYGFDSLSDLSVQTTAYYDAIEVDDLTKGRIDVKNNRVFGSKTYSSTVTFKPKGHLSTKGNLDRFRAGRIDLKYDRDGKGMQKHWSSNRNVRQSVRNYFGKWRKSNKLGADGKPQWYIKPRNSFVTCAVGDCESSFAKSFGKVIPPKGKRASDVGKTWRPTSTIIVAGDISGPAKALRRRCEVEGCIVLNSRDVPPETKSDRLVVTGHYFKSGNSVWRQAPESLSELSPVVGYHRRYNPIDTLNLKSLPEGSVQHVAFESCNSVKSTEPGASISGAGVSYSDQLLASYPTLKNLQTSYPDLQTIQGYDGKTSYRGSVPIATSYDDMYLYQSSRVAYRAGKREIDKRAWYVKGEDNRWYYTTDGRTCTDAVTFTDSKCKKMIVS